MEKILKNIYGAQLENYTKKKVSLPMYLTESREFWEVTVFGIKFILVNFTAMDRLNVTVLKKHGQKYYEYFNENIAYGFPNLTSSQRKSLTENRISYISGNEQIFLPFLGSYFTKCYRNQMSKSFDKFSPSTQLLALYMIYGEKSRKINKSEVAKQIGLSAMSITRAVKDLVKLGILQEEKIGNEALIYCDMDKSRIYEEISPYLINPVQEIIYVEKITYDNLVMAGEYSLSKRSMLGYPKYEEYAIAKNSDLLNEMETYNPDLNIIRLYWDVMEWQIRFH